jgi:integrase
MAFPEYKGIGKKGQAKFRLYYDGPKKTDGSRNQLKESFSVFPLPEKAAAIIKAAENRRLGNITKTEALLLERFEEKAKDIADFEARKKEQLVNDPNYVEPVKVDPVIEDRGELFPKHSARWFKFKAGTARNGRRSPKTMERYEELLKRIDEFFTNTYVEDSDINVDKVEEFYAWLAVQPKKLGKRKNPPKDPERLSKRSLWHYHRCLYSILEYAVARGKLSSNPCRHVHPEVPDDDIEEKKPDSYNAEQVSKIHSLIAGESIKHRVMVSVALEIGPRPEEYTALNWADIDFKTRLVDFNKTWQYIRGKGSIEKSYLKNKKSRRKARLSASTIFLLKQLKSYQESEAERLGTKWVDSGAVFVNWNGEKSSATWATDWWRNWIKKTDLPVKSLYCLKHTCISLLMDAGKNPLEVAHMVGHSNAEMLWRVYGHPVQKEQFNGADVMENIMNKKTKEKIEEIS